MPVPQPERVEELFERVCELATIERMAVLDEECAGESTLRLRVDALIATMYESDVVPDPEQRPFLPAMVSRRKLAPGSYIDRYRVLREIGEGATGTVYEAENERIHSRVAIKVLHADRCASPRAAERFVDEARAVNIINHANIVKVYDIGQLDSGDAYIVMEYLAGRPLGNGALLAGLPKALKATVFARQIASALSAAHAQGIVHRDLKPANVLVIRDPETLLGERVKLLDFGLAKLSENLRRPGSLVSDEHMIAGTPADMSPEQCMGEHVDSRSDVYSLGIILFELLTGETPFRAASTARMFNMHREIAPPRLRDLAPAVSRELAALVDDMLRKNPDDRPVMRRVARRLDALIHAYASGEQPALSSLQAHSFLAGRPQRLLLGPRWTGLARIGQHVGRVGRWLSKRVLRLLRRLR